MTLSMNLCIDYFLDSLTGYSQETRRNYERDLQQLKLYLVLFRPHTLMESALVGTSHAKIAQLKAQLEKSQGKLWDTRSLKRRYDRELTSQTILDSIDIDVTKLRKEDIAGFFGYLESTKGLSRATLLRRLASLRRFFRFLSKEGYAVDSGLIDRLADISIRRERKLPMVLSADEVLSFLQSIDNVRDRTIIIVMLFMGLRISEVVSLNVDEITDAVEGVTLRGKGAKERYVPVHQQVRTAVAAYKSIRPDAEEDKLGEPLFVSNRGKRIDPSTVRKFIKRYCMAMPDLDARKRRHLSPHKFRHTFATLLLSGGVDIRYIQELLGHQNLSTTEIYTSVQTQELTRAVAKHPLGDIMP
ncbi:MAG TPA: tyrosine-type recombinase/integrase [Firmicutes bacterium]|jgi:site-specific recombinase XerD|nr:tyrosine-type recombinase/integrase [Bacillota bacterium]